MARGMASALIIDNKRLLLLYNSKHGKIRREPPGGKLEDGETLRECNERECLEELGIRVLAKKPLGTYRTESPEGQFDVTMFFSDIIQGQPRIMQPTKHGGFGYHTYKELETFREDGTLVPNLIAALPELRQYVS